MRKVDSKIAEFVGMHIGDGTLYKTSWCLVWELRGSLNEKEYYFDHVKPLLEEIFSDLEFSPKFRAGGKQGCFGIQCSNKQVTSLFSELGFSPGPKSHTVSIPDYIKTASKQIKLAFLRGLFDTDGCIRFDKINGQKLHTYPRIEFCFASKVLRDDLAELVKSVGFRCFIWGKTNFKLCIAGHDQAEKWFSEVRSGNKKHLNRHQFHRSLGFYTAAVA